MDLLGMCSLCSISHDYFIPLTCLHTVCLKCPTKQNMQQNTFVCPLCHQRTYLQQKTLQKLQFKNSSSQKTLNPEQQQNNKQKQLQSIFSSTIQSIKKTFNYLLQQLQRKQAALIYQLTCQYKAQIFKINAYSQKKNQNQCFQLNFVSTSNSFQKILKGAQLVFNLTPIQKQIMNLEFRHNNSEFTNKYIRSSQLKDTRVKQAINFQQDKSYNKIMKILNQSRSTLQINMKSIKNREKSKIKYDVKDRKQINNET